MVVYIKYKDYHFKTTKPTPGGGMGGGGGYAPFFKKVSFSYLKYAVRPCYNEEFLLNEQSSICSFLHVLRFYMCFYSLFINTFGFHFRTSSQSPHKRGHRGFECKCSCTCFFCIFDYLYWNFDFVCFFSLHFWLFIFKLWSS